MTRSAAEVADAWLPAFLSGQRADPSLYAEGAVTWHNIGEHETVIVDPPSQSRARKVIPDLHHEDVTLTLTERGFVLQSVAVGTTSHGPVRVATCLVVTVEDGRITRFEEYADSAAAAPVIAAIAAADADA